MRRVPDEAELLSWFETLSNRRRRRDHARRARRRGGAPRRRHAALALQGVALEAGDALLLRTGSYPSFRSPDRPAAARQRRLFQVAPLHISGGTDSPVNPIALL